MWMWIAHAFYADATDLPYLILLLYNMQQKSDLCDFIDNIAIFFILFDVIDGVKISVYAQSTAK